MTHGNVSRYIAGCRCHPCNDAHTVYYRDLKARHTREAVAIRQERWARIAESYGGVGEAIAGRIRAGE